VAALIAGCGGSSAPITPISTGASGASGTAGAAPLSKPAYIEQADAICAESNAALGDAEAVSDPKIQAVQEAQTVKSELSGLQTLTPPSEDSATLDQFLGALQDEVRALGRKRLAIQRNDNAALTSVEADVSSAEGDAQSAADQYGLKDCSKGAQASTTTPTTGAPTTTSVAPTTPTTTTPAPAPAPTPPAGGTGGSGGGTGGVSPGGGGGGSGGGVGVG
jgi:hypothetical protein